MIARILTATLFLLVAGWGATGRNLAQNPGFEMGPPPGPGVAEAWMPYSAEPGPVQFFVVDQPWMVHGGGRSQVWFADGPQRGGIAQPITGVTPGQTCEASVFFGDTEPPLPYGPTQFRIGIEPSGGPPDSPNIVWSAWTPVTGQWQQAAVQTEALAPQITLVLESRNLSSGGPPQYQYPAPFNRVIVDDAVVAVAAPPCTLIANVPDANQPPNNPLGYPNVNGYCAPMAAVNITQYWDVVMGNASAANVNAGLGTQNAAPYIGHWMDTNNFPAGCPFRANGTTLPAFGKGTYVADLAPGVAQFARWDAANTFGCTPPPNLPAGKNGYSWTVVTTHNKMQNQAQAWNQLVAEIDAGRPFILGWSYWNPVATGVVDASGVTYYLWGNVVGNSGAPNPDEDWNYPDDPEANPQGAGAVGHFTTAVGYCKNHDPDGGGPLPQANWAVVHDNWNTTAQDVAIPWAHQQLGWSPWVSNTTVRLVAPQVGTLNVAPGPKNPKNHWWWSGKSPNVMAQLRLTAGAVEIVEVNAVTLVAAGTGNDQNDILGVDLVDDANSNGKADAGEATLASGAYPADNGTLTIQIPGPTYTVPANGSRDMLVVYRMSNAAPLGKTYNFQIPTIYATGAVTFLPIAPAGLPYNSPTKTIVKITLNPCPRIGWWRTHPDGTWGRIVGCSPVVSAGTGRFADRIYIQEDDRSAGIPVYFGDEQIPTIPEGAILEFEAVIDTINGERVLVQPTVVAYTPGPIPQPLFVINKSVGGGPSAYDPGVSGGVGLSNEGLLVRTSGRVTYVGPDYFLMSDRLISGGGPTPDDLKVSLAGLAPGNSVLPPPVGLYISVTGLAGKEPDGGGGYRAILRPRSGPDMQVVPSPYSLVRVDSIIRDRVIHLANETASFTVRVAKTTPDPFTGSLVVKVVDYETGTVAMSAERAFSMGSGETIHDEVFGTSMPHDAVWDIVAWVLDSAGYVEGVERSEYGVRPGIPDVPEDVLTYKVTPLSPTSLRAQIESQDLVTLQIGGRTFDIDVVPNDMMLSEEVRAMYPSVKLYKGTIIGNEESEVRLTFDSDSVSGYLMSSLEDVQVIEPLMDYYPGAGPTDYAAYNSAAVRHPGFGEDGEEGSSTEYIYEPAAEPPGPAEQVGAAPTVRTLLRLNVYSDTANNALDHINDVEGTLSHEANVRISVNTTTTNLNTNGYSAPSNCGTGNASALNSFSTDPSVNLTNADKAILFTNNGALNYGNVVGCGFRPGNYCWVRHQGSAWTVRLTAAHELGHNFGLVHDNGKTRTETRGIWPFTWTVDHYGIMSSSQRTDDVWDDNYNTQSVSQRPTATTNAANQCPRRSARWTGNELGFNNVRLRDWEVQYTNNPARGDSMNLTFLYSNSTNNAINLTNLFYGCRNPNDANRDFGHVGAVTIGAKSTYTRGWWGWTGTAGGVAGNWHFWPAYSYNCSGSTCWGPYKWHEAVINFR